MKILISDGEGRCGSCLAEGLEKGRNLLFRAVCCAGLVVLSVACAPAVAPTPIVVPPKVPWRVIACEGDAYAQVRIASNIPVTDLTADCTGAWSAGFVQVSVRFDGAFNEELNVRATWSNTSGEVIPIENVFDRQFSLGSAATRTETWNAPTPKARSLRLDVSCARC